MRACGDPRRPHGWIDEDFVAAYCRLHDLGWAHSVETWQDDELAGGVYGVRVGGLFAGESMFHRVTDASKVALWAAVELLRMDGVDVVRRAVDDAPPGVTGRGRRVRERSIRSCSTRR